MFRTLTPIFSILLAVVIYFSYVQPTYDAAVTLREDNERYVTAVQNASELNKNLDKLVQDKSQYSTQESRLNVLLPRSVDEVSLLVELQALARKNGMLLGNVAVKSDDALPVAGGAGVVGGVQSPTTPPSASGVTLESLSHSDISFGLIGTYEQFKSFLRDVETNLVLMEFTNISFSATKGTFLQFSVSVRAYALPR